MAVAPAPATTEMTAEGVKFGVVPFPLPAENRLKSRYDPVVEQVTNLLMQHGKKSVAQRVRPAHLHKCLRLPLQRR